MFSGNPDSGGVSDRSGVYRGVGGGWQGVSGWLCDIASSVRMFPAKHYRSWSFARDPNGIGIKSGHRDSVKSGPFDAVRFWYVRQARRIVAFNFRPRQTIPLASRKTLRYDTAMAQIESLFVTRLYRAALS